MEFNKVETPVLLDFDGDEHYQNTLKIKADREKNQEAEAAGSSYVRFPYWVQLDSTTLNHFFGLVRRVETNFRHGFITTRIYSPSYCELGLRRFQDELYSLPHAVRVAVISSLRERCREHGTEFVLPSEMRILVE